MMHDGAAKPNGADLTADTDVPGQVDLEDLLLFLRDARGFDFGGYKRTTLGRRIRKRMHDVGVDKYQDYRDRLESSNEEFGQLFNTILINVTDFFRDPEAWAHLDREIIPDIAEHSNAGQEIRVWSAGCSTGEEAFTLAIMFAEVLGVDECLARLKIYGTDVDDDALRDARAGIYAAKALEPVPEELRGKYFQATSTGEFAFRADLRRRVIFGRHDITRDAPISRLDLLVCRNTLMYFNTEAQSHILDRFSFALRERGYLFLGRAETLSADGARFEIASMRERLFRRRAGEVDGRFQPITPLPLELEPIGRDISRRRQLRDLVLETSPTATIALGADGRVGLINAQARAQFRLTAHDIGRPFHELEVSYRPAELRSLIDQATAERRMVRINGIERRLGPEEIHYFDIIVVPLWTEDFVALGVALFFVDVTTSTRLQQEVRQTREDLETAYEELQSTNEELETTNEELQSSVEELETTNEELQSTNEELETTNQELQAGNDELGSVNEEIRIRSAELDEARTFLEGVLASVANGVVVLDLRFTVRTWNNRAADLWGLRQDEVFGKVFFDLEFGLPTSRLRETVEACGTTRQRLGPVEIDAVSRLGRSIMCAVTCSPLDGHDGGVVLLMEEKSRT